MALGADVTVEVVALVGRVPAHLQVQGAVLHVHRAGRALRPRPAALADAELAVAPLGRVEGGAPELVLELQLPVGRRLGLPHDARQGRRTGGDGAELVRRRAARPVGLEAEHAAAVGAADRHALPGRERAGAALDGDLAVLAGRGDLRAADDPGVHRVGDAGAVLGDARADRQMHALAGQGRGVGRRAVRRRTGQSEGRGGQGGGTGQRDDRGLQEGTPRRSTARSRQATCHPRTSRNSHMRGDSWFV